MKNVFTFIVVFMVSFVLNEVMAQGKPKIVFTNTEHNFGSFKESDGVQTTAFEFINQGDAPLILNAVTASCGCTTPEWTRQPIAPGQKGSIKVAYDPANRPGAFSKTATVRSNADVPVVVLTISGRVEEREKNPRRALSPRNR
jgi:hypothetical protein